MEAAIDGASSFVERVVREALNTLLSVVFETAASHLFAIVLFIDEESAFAGIAAVVVVEFAVGDGASIVFEVERPVALEASVIVFLYLAAQHVVVSATAEHQRVLWLAFGALSLLVIFSTVFHTYHASSSLLSVPNCAFSARISIIFKASFEDRHCHPH